MICPSCGHKNIPGSDGCESCHQNLSSLDGVVPKTKLEKVLMSDPISKISLRPPSFIGGSASVMEAVKQMNASHVGCLLVVSGNYLDGIVTERDVVLKALGLNKKLETLPVSEIMTANPENLSVDASLAYAVNRMSIGGYRHVPILKDGKPIGVISIRDVLKYLSKLFP